MRKNPAAVDTKVKHIRQLIKNGQNPKAIQHYRTAITTLADTAVNHIKFGQLAKQLDLLTEAETRFKAALQHNPAGIHPLVELARIYTQRGQMSDALSMLEQVIHLDPHHKFALQHRDYLLKLVAHCGLNIGELNKTGPVYFPGIAFDAIINKLLQHYPCKYDPVPKRQAFVIFNMRLGGIQKKVASMIHHLQSAHGKIEHIKLFCKSLSHLKGDAFLLPLYKQYGIDIEEYAPATARPAFDHPLLEDHAGLLCQIHIVGADIVHLAAALLEYKPEVVHAFGYQAAEFGMAAAIAGVPRIVLYSGNMRPGTMGSTDLWVDHVRTAGHAYRALARLPNVTIANNCQAAATDYEDWLDLPAGRVQVVYNGVDFSALSRPDPETSQHKRLATGIPASAPVIGTAMRFTVQKRPFLWLETAKRIAEIRPDVHFVVLGDGELLERFAENVKANNLSVRFHLPGAVTDMLSWYGLMDIVLLTSSMEGTSNVAIEAQFLEIPVVSTNVGGMTETILHGKSGWIVDRPEPELLAGKIIWTLEHPEWYTEAGRIGKEFVQQQFNMEKMIGMLLSISRDNPRLAT